MYVYILQEQKTIFDDGVYHWINKKAYIDPVVALIEYNDAVKNHKEVWYHSGKYRVAELTLVEEKFKP